MYEYILVFNNRNIFIHPNFHFYIIKIITTFILEILILNLYLTSFTSRLNSYSVLFYFTVFFYFMIIY